MKKYGIVIVAFNPDIKKFNKKISDLANDENATIVVVNNGDKISKISRKNVIYKDLQGNKGIAYAQNVGVDVLKDIEQVFLFDQDSDLTNDYCKKMLSKWDEIAEKDSKIGVLAPSVYDRKSKQTLSTKIFNGETLEKKILKEGDVYNTLPISSGILIDTTIFKQVGGNDADYFIDWVDFNFDLSVIKAGYHVYSTADIQIEHQIGNATARKFLFKEIHPTNHSAFRNYYFFRNGILFIYDNKSYNSMKKFAYENLIKRFIYIFYEENSISKIKAMFKGLKDGYELVKQKRLEED